ncbi:DUF4440 domain-containing protein [Pseudomethylobacillus aquaticus]|uniref:DUF4440 domain-containing protein n=1 Tax=Pseudomethylobacillus aquaticus TaxID=2676064 RepID=A0A3N0V3K1_9PROT|nr:DUF4440 domain-containing protein [Pseudomethylobacillus aquaticus]ROH87048.1 DUF4440 domain-containing protein [Pseudomethylobacillus aquaticus]
MKIDNGNVELQAQFSEMNAQWDAAFNSQQATLVASFYDDEATVLPAGAAQVSCGKSILEFWTNTLAQGIVDHKIELIEAGGDEQFAFQRGLWSAAAVDAQGQRQQFSGNLHLLYRKQPEGGWKIFTHIWN